MATTQSGFPVVDDYEDPQLLKNPDVPGSSAELRGGVRAGDVATVLLYVAERFHREVESLVQSRGVWGYDKRLIGNGPVWSNHASGTAIDLNADDHPHYARGTFSAGQVNTIRSIVDSCDGVIGWGGEWDDSSVDEMHFQIDNDQAPNVPALAARLRNQGGSQRDFLAELLGWNS